MLLIIECHNMSAKIQNFIVIDVHIVYYLDIKFTPFTFILGYIFL